MTLAFSTSSDSANAIRSVGFLFLNSCSFISCIGHSRGKGNWGKCGTLSVPEALGSKGSERRQGGEKAILLSVRRPKSKCSLGASTWPRRSERLNHHEDHDSDQDQCRDLVDDPPVARRLFVAVLGKFSLRGRQVAV